MPLCLVCGSHFEPFMTFGGMPIANGFLSPEQFSEEYFGELKVGFCEQCGMVQLAELIEPQKLFHSHYPFYSSSSTHMACHFKELAELVMRQYVKSEEPFVV